MLSGDFPLTRRSFLLLAGIAPFGIACHDPLYAGPLAATYSPPEAGRQVFLQTAQVRQTIEHFGASDCWTIDPVGKKWTKENKERLADLLFSRDKGIGLSLWRFNLGAGDTGSEGYGDPWRRPESLQSAPGAPIDTSKQSGQQWFLKAAKRRGVEKTLAFVNSPPVWLTKNGRAFGDKNDSGTNLKPGSERAFGKYLVDILRHFEKQGNGFDYISPANEPNWRWNGGQEGCSYHPDEMRRMTLAVAEELRAAKIGARIRLGELGDYRALLDDADYRTFLGVSQDKVTYGSKQQYFRVLLGDPAVREAVDDCFLAHSYWTDTSPHDLENLRSRVRGNFDRYVPGGRFWQSEYCVMENRRDLGMDMALRVASVIHHDLVYAGASSWSWWTALSQVDYKDGLIYTDYNGRNNTEQNILPSKTLWALGNWSRFVRPGAQRIEALTDALPDELLATAYVSGNRRELIVTLVNQSGVAIPVRFGADRAVRELTPYITDATRDLARGKALPTSAPIAIPPRSVVTLVGQMGDPAGAAPAPLLAPKPKELPADKYLYAVECGLSATDRVTGSRRNTRADMPYGRDPGTGFSWGYVSYGRTNGHVPENPPVPKTDATPTSAPPARGVRVEEGDAAGQGITYRFAVEPKRKLTVEMEWFDPWNNPNRRMAVTVQGKTVETALLPGQGYLVRQYETTSSPEGLVEVQVARAADNNVPDADPLVSRIRLRDG